MDFWDFGAASGQVLQVVPAVLSAAGSGCACCGVWQNVMHLCSFPAKKTRSHTAGATQQESSVPFVPTKLLTKDRPHLVQSPTNATKRERLLLQSTSRFDIDGQCDGFCCCIANRIDCVALATPASGLFRSIGAHLASLSWASWLFVCFFRHLDDSELFFSQLNNFTSRRPR